MPGRRDAGKSGLALPFDLGAADDTGRTSTAGLGVAEGQRVHADDLAVEIAVGVDDDDGLAVLTGQFADHRFLRCLAVAAESLIALEAATFLVRNLNHDILLEQTRLFERAFAAWPMTATAGDDRISLAGPFAFDVGDLIGGERA